MPLEQLTDGAGAPQGLPRYAGAAAPILSRRSRISAGDAPAYADYIVFGRFQWARCVSPFELLPSDDPVVTWRERMLGRFDVARNARRAV